MLVQFLRWLNYSAPAVNPLPTCARYAAPPHPPMLCGMDVHAVDSRPSDKQRQLDDLKQANPAPGKLFSRGQTALSKGFDEIQERWLLAYACSRWTTLHSALGAWRTKLKRFEKMADDDYSDRREQPDARTTDAIASIFARQNHTLGVVSGFADFAYAQARDDIFGTRPWLAATPEGPASDGLADRVTKNSQWKLNQSNLESTLLDGIRIGMDLGTAFVKLRYVTETETSEQAETVAVSKLSKKPVLNKAGDYIHDAKDLPEGFDPADLEWQERLVENVQEVRNNVDSALVDFNNIAFDPTAAEMTLWHTDVFSRFRMGLHDLVAAYNLSDAQRDELAGICNSEGNEEARQHRNETDTQRSDAYKNDSESNPEVWMVEGFLRCDPFKTGKVLRLHVIFSPMLNAMFHCDYLANVTPAGILPVFPIRCFKIANRIIGRGYFERYEDAGNAIDGQYNAVTYRNRMGAEVIKGFHRTALANEAEGEDLILSPEKLYELKEDKTLADLISFATIPDSNNRAVELMNQMLQLAQMRTGITSAAQGELKGVPNANTATGVRQLTSRGAVLLKWPIDQVTDDLTPIVELAVHLHYANHAYRDNPSIAHDLQGNRSQGMSPLVFLVVPWKPALAPARAAPAALATPQPAIDTQGTPDAVQANLTAAERMRKMRAAKAAKAANLEPALA
jgi:hypothetical protein